ncbi:hypothetical protein COJ96_08450 [Bacillus sp. AFS073361]|uniref:hypothetical protein n=1 Tax=Bacillus sp. AFS073361 TaxID=2033511 RepID=UPI000BF80181|nr:hypothetical protein [Bacillus sp. AFS073361]PFP29711.1 hypothetical protein COJ96_08450 [Bacillus sp. AFS073361]
MESMHQDRDSFYKKIETEINKRIHAYTNNRKFTIAFGNAMETHVKHLKIHRRLATRRLNQLGLPNKDEISAISVRIVDYEEKLDLLDESIFWMNKRQKENRNKLKMIRESWGALQAVLEKETREIHACKLKSLEEELNELKQLFELNLEEKKHDE